MVIPTEAKAEVSPDTMPRMKKSTSVDSGTAIIVDDDDLPPAMPKARNDQISQSPNARHVPTRSLTDGVITLSSSADLQSSTSQRLRRASNRSDTQSIPRQSSPLKTASAPAEEFQIHEDPANARTNGVEVSPPSPQEPRVLNELPINESSQPSHMVRENHDQEPVSPTQTGEATKGSALSPVASPESKTEVVRSRKLLISGIERIKSHTLDAHGFRKVIELVRSSESGDVFGSVGEGRRFDDLVGALLEYIVAPLEPVSGSTKHTQELKRQAITVLRVLLNKQNTAYKKWISSGRWCQRILAGAFDARKSVDGLGLLVKDIETLTSEIPTKVQPEEGEGTILTWLEQADHGSHSEQGEEHDSIVELPQDSKETGVARATALALRTLSSFLTAAGDVPVTTDITIRVAHTTAACLQSTDAEVRKAAVELATDLHGIWPATEEGANDSKSDYWTLLESCGVQESARNLIVYFTARKAKSA